MILNVGQVGGGGAVLICAQLQLCCLRCLGSGAAPHPLRDAVKWMNVPSSLRGESADTEARAGIASAAVALLGVCFHKLRQQGHRSMPPCFMRCPHGPSCSKDRWVWMQTRLMMRLPPYYRRYPESQSDNVLSDWRLG